MLCIVLCDIASVRTAVVIAECTSIIPQCKIQGVRSNSYTQAVYPSPLMLLNTYIDQMQTVQQADNRRKARELLVNRTSGRETGAVHPTPSALARRSVQTGACGIAAPDQERSDLSQQQEGASSQVLQMSGQQNDVLCCTSSPCHATDYTNKRRYEDTIFTRSRSHLDAVSAPVPSCFPDPKSSTWRIKVQSTNVWRGQMRCNVLVWAVGLQGSWGVPWFAFNDC